MLIPTSLKRWKSIKSIEKQTYVNSNEPKNDENQ